jgi:hypothetical protein
MRQRGFAVSLILIGLAVAALVAMVGGFAWKMRNDGIATGIAREQPKTKAAEQRAANAEARLEQQNAALDEAQRINKANLAEVETLRQRFAQTQKTLDDILKLQDERQRDTQAALAKFNERDKRQSSEIKRLRAIAETPAGITITDGGASEADAILRNAVRDALGLRQR